MYPDMKRTDPKFFLLKRFLSRDRILEHEWVNNFNHLSSVGDMTSDCTRSRRESSFSSHAGLA